MSIISSLRTKLLSKFLPGPLSLGAEVSKDCVKLALVKIESHSLASLLDYALIPLNIKDQQNKREAVSVIAGVLKEKKLFTATDVKIAISGDNVDSKRITLPHMPKDEIGQALRLQAKDMFLLNAEESILDFEILKEDVDDDGTKVLDIIATMAKNSLVEEKLSSFKESEVITSGVIPVAYCLSNLCTLSKDKYKDPVALVDLGTSSSTLTIMTKGEVRFIRQMGCGGEDFTKAIAGTSVPGKEGAGFSLDEAERLKKQAGVPDGSQHQVLDGIPLQHLSALLRPIVEKMATDIKRSFDYYVSQFDEGNISRVILTGGASKLKNLATELSSRLQLPVEDLKIPKKLKLELSKDKAETVVRDFPMISPSIGAALGDFKGVNLIPDSYKGEVARRIKRLSIRIVFIVISLVLLMLHGLNVAQEKALKNVLLAKGPEWQKLQDAQNLHRMISQKNNIINQTLENQAPLYYILKTLSSLVPNEVYFEDIRIENKASHLIIKGITLETKDTAEVSLAGFIKSMEDSSLFNNVLLDSSKDVIVSERDAVEFQISCDLIEKI